MEKFPPNLDDGELWLPADIIPDVGARRRHHHHLLLHPSASVGGGLRPPSIDFSVLDPRQLAGLALLDHPTQLLRPPPPPVNLPSHFSLSLQGSKGFRPVLRLGPAEEIDVSSVYKGFRPPPPSRMELPVGGDDGLMPGMTPFGPIKPVEPQVEMFGVKSGGGRGFQRPVQRRFVPVQPVRPAIGTGVFLPRVNHRSTSKPRERKEEQEQEKRQQKPASNNNGVGRKKSLPSQPYCSPAAATAAEIGLPQDWTY